MLDPELLNLVRRSLRSVWALEILMAVRRRAPQPVELETIVRELRATRSLVRRITEQLVVERLFVLEDAETVLFQPATTELRNLCDQLEIASRNRPIALLNAIVSSHDDKLQNFSDAFRFTDKDKGK